MYSIAFPNSHFNVIPKIKTYKFPKIRLTKLLKIRFSFLLILKKVCKISRKKLEKVWYIFAIIVASLFCADYSVLILVYAIGFSICYITYYLHVVFTCDLSCILYCFWYIFTHVWLVIPIYTYSYCVLI